MGDIIGRTLGIFLAVSLLFLLPLLYFAERQETVEQMYLITETADFVDTVRTTGRLTKESYEAFKEKLNGLSGRYELKMTGSRQRIELSGQTLYLNKEEFYKKQIEEELFKEGAYSFCEGDFFRVELVKQSSGFLNRMENFLFAGLFDSKSAQVYYGGMVGYDGD